MLQNPEWLPEGGLLGYHCTSKYANIGQDGKYVVETCLKGNDMAFWSAAKILGLQPEVHPVWQNPHYQHNYSEDEYEDEYEDEDEDVDEDEDEDEDEYVEKCRKRKESKWKRDQKFIISNKWNLDLSSSCKYEIERLHLPEKEGYDVNKITWCNSQDRDMMPNLGHLGLTFKREIPESNMGNEPATDDMPFYNMAGIFCKIRTAVERCDPLHVPVITKRSREY